MRNESKPSFSNYKIIVFKYIMRRSFIEKEKAKYKSKI